MTEYIVCPYCHNPLSQSEYVKVVRCRDCKHCKRRNGILPPTVCERWGYYNFETEPDRFCAWGERKVVDE